MNYKIEHLNNGEEIVNPKVEGLVNIDIILTDENGDKFGVQLPVNIDSLKINDKNLQEACIEYLKQFKV